MAQNNMMRLIVKLTMKPKRSLLLEEQIKETLKSYNTSEFLEIFENSAKIQPKLTEITNNLFLDPENIQDSLQQEYNNLLAVAHFYQGEIHYFGLISKKINLLAGFGHYLTAAFFGNPHALYKLYILFETNIISVILKTRDFDKLFQDKTSVLSHIRNSTFFNHFIYTDDYERKAAAVHFLYASSLSNLQSSLTTLGFKYYKGYGLQHSCDNAQKFYKSASHEIVKDIYKRRKPSFYEKASLEQYEYIGNKFAADSFEIDEIVDYFKVEAEIAP
jgi:TPR repeat protein